MNQNRSRTVLVPKTSASVEWYMTHHTPCMLIGLFIVTWPEIPSLIEEVADCMVMNNCKEHTG